MHITYEEWKGHFSTPSLVTYSARKWQYIVDAKI